MHVRRQSGFNRLAAQLFVKGFRLAEEKPIVWPQGTAKRKMEGSSMDPCVGWSFGQIAADPDGMPQKEIAIVMPKLE